jgi:hypothetical protein
MTASRSQSKWSPRQTLRAATLFWGCALAIWVGGSFVDLRDGQTWRQTKRRYVSIVEARGFEVNDFGFYRVVREAHPKEFKEVVMLRGLLPAVVLGTFFGVSALGWLSQPRSAGDRLP